MRDPDEGVSPEGLLVTGARRDRVPAKFEPVLAYVASRLGPSVALYVYGSVATGQARIPGSDVDLLTVGLPRDLVLEVADLASAEFTDLCRAVEIAAAASEELVGESDEAYGNRAFLKHYCVHLAGPDPAAGLPPVLADVRAARGFNGDIGRHLDRWRQQVDARPPSELARAIARKTLLAVAGLVSVHDRTWTTDRSRAAERWAQIEPSLGPALERLLLSTCGQVTVDTPAGLLAPGAVVETVATRFRDTIGLWEPAPGPM